MKHSWRQVAALPTRWRAGNKEMKIGTPNRARFCAGVQLNAPTYRTDDACRQAGVVEMNHK
jgi:hypothetical protein